MRLGFLAATMILATVALLGCGGDEKTVPPDPFELDGEWLYLGPWDGGHTLEIGDGSMVYADVDGAWSSAWSVTEYDNGLRRFQIAFESGNGTYLPVGQKLSGTYDSSGTILTVQLADGADSYEPVQSPGSCATGASELIANCRVYLSQN